MRRFLLLLLLALALTGNALADTSVTLTFVGDCTLGSEERTRANADSYDSFVKAKGYDYFFANVRSLFLNDDLTVINLEGVLSDSAAQEKRDKTYRFRGPTDFVKILTGSSVEICNLANNHTGDYGNQGAESTRNVLDEAGIGWFSSTDFYIAEVKGLRIAFFALQPSTFSNNKAWCASEIKRLKEEEDVSACVFVFHAGQEYATYRNAAQENFARYAIGAGADLVIMHHPHVLQGLEVLNNRTICYSLGNFSFGGNCKVRSLDTAVFQVTMDFTDDGQYKGQQVAIFPAHISDDPEDNHYQPVLVNGADAEAVMARIQRDSSFTLTPFDEETGCALQPYVPANSDGMLIVTNAPGEYPKK